MWHIWYLFFRTFNFRKSNHSTGGSSVESGFGSVGTPTLPYSNPCKRKLDLRWVVFVCKISFYYRLILVPPFPSAMTPVVCPLELTAFWITLILCAAEPTAVHLVLTTFLRFVPMIQWKALMDPKMAPLAILTLPKPSARTKFNFETQPNRKITLV